MQFNIKTIKTEKQTHLQSECLLVKAHYEDLK